MFEGGGAAGGYHAPFGTGDGGESFSDPFRQLVILNEVVGSRLHGRPDGGKFQRATDDGKGSAAVDDRLHADASEDIGIGGHGLMRFGFRTEDSGQFCRESDDPEGLEECSSVHLGGHGRWLLS